MAVARRGGSLSGANDSPGQVSSRTTAFTPGNTTDDIVVLFVEIWASGAQAAPTITWPTGFVGNEFISASQTVAAGGTLWLKAAWARVTTAHAADYVTSFNTSYWSMSGQETWSGCVNTGSPVDVSNTAGGTGTSVPTTTATATGLDAMLHLFTTYNEVTSTPATGFTERQDATVLHVGTAIAGAAGSQSAAGAVVSVSTTILAALALLKPPSSGTAMPLAVATETDTGSALTAAKAQTYSAATETSTSRAATLLKALTLGLATGANTALALTASKALPLALATGGNTAQPLNLAKAAPLGVATETNSAPVMTLAGAGSTPMPLALASETGTARALVLAKAWTAPSASESDQARPVSLSKGLVLALAQGTGTARAVMLSKATLFGRGQETGAALAMALGPVVEYEPATDWTLTTHPLATAATRGTPHRAATRQRSYTATTRSEQ